ncbi:RNA 3'-terminal phosphate cyclase/enolpyruvate transferase [Lactifluus volemus]|nr:RNA 3'-terminal phosphate cyclase/enolpyruvate transferase [Lactifluus volemus]
MDTLQYSGHLYFRHRLVLSILAGKAIKIDKIRPADKDPGLRDYEVSLLRLIEKVTNGTIIEISLTGTAILVKPGIISGGQVFHECPLSRSIGYFLESIIMLAPGITTDDKDLYSPHLEPFGISDGLELKIKKRGSPPLGGGEVLFLCPIVKQVKTLNFFSNRMIEASRSVLNRYIPDIYLYSDVYKGEESGKSPGYALSLVAETTTSAFHCAEAVSQPGVAPEDIALQATRSLLCEIERGGCVDQKHQTLVLLMMMLGSEDVGRCRMAEPTERTIQFLRDVRDAFGTSFKIVPADRSDDSSQLLYSCYGTGYVNTNRSLA